MDAARRHLILEPAAQGSLVLLARTAARGGRPEAAQPLLARAAASAPGDPGVASLLARGLFRLGRFADALVASRRAIRLGARDHDQAFLHARIARAAGETDLATTVLDRLEQAAPAYRTRRAILDLTATTDDMRIRLP